MTKKPVVLNDTEDTLEVLASSIRDVSAAAKKMLGGPLRRRALVILLQDAIPGNLAIRDIEAVLDAAAALEGKYLVKNPEVK